MRKRLWLGWGIFAWIGAALLLGLLWLGMARRDPGPIYPTVFLDTGGDTFHYVKNSLGGTYLEATRIHEDGTIEGLWGDSQLAPPWPACRGIFLWDRQQGLRSVYTLPERGRQLAEPVSARWVLLLDVEDRKSARYVLWSEETGELALPLPPGRRGTAVDVNAGGMVLAICGNRSAVWTREKGLTEIAVPLKDRRRSMLALNDGGMVLGQTDREAFVWNEADGVTLLGEGTVAGLLNEHGWVAGKIKPEESAAWSVFLWTREKGLEILATFEDAATFEVAALTETGVVLGTIQYAGEQGVAVFRWSREAGLEVSPPFDGQKRAEIRDWNKQGVAVGNVFAGKEQFADARPFVWLPGKAPELLPLLEGAKSSTAKKINDHGQVIGESRSPTLSGKGWEGWVWSREAGIRELDIKVPWKDSQVRTGHWGVGVTDINNAGQIVGVVNLYELGVEGGLTAFERVWWPIRDWLAELGIGERKFHNSRRGLFMRFSAVLWEVPPEENAAELESRRKRD